MRFRKWGNNVMHFGKLPDKSGWHKIRLRFQRLHFRHLDERPLKSTRLPLEARKELSSRSARSPDLVLLAGIFPRGVGVRHTENDLISWTTWKGCVALLVRARWVLSDVRFWFLFYSVWCCSSVLICEGDFPPGDCKLLRRGVRSLPYCECF